MDYSFLYLPLAFSILDPSKLSKQDLQSLDSDETNVEILGNRKYTEMSLFPRFLQRYVCLSVLIIY